MKYLITLLFTIFCSIHLFAQISTTSVPKKPKAEVAQNLKFDKNFQGVLVKRYLGQVLYVNGVRELQRKFAYDNFFKDAEAEEAYKNNYDLLVGRYFEVIEIINHKFFNTHVLKLKDINNGQVLYYRYSTKHEFLFPFLVVSYFEKLKEDYIGEKIILTDKANKLVKFFSPEDKKLNLDITYWECIDVTVEEEYFKLSLILITKDKKKAYIPYDYLNNLEKRKKEYFLKSQAEVYANKFGEDIWTDILQGSIQVGFTEEMALLSWGKPDKINKSSYNSQWVYDNQYLYFEKGVLTSFN